MPYTFIPADNYLNGRKHTYADMAELRAAFSPIVVSVTKSKQLVDQWNNVLGRVMWVKGDRAPKMVQPSDDATTLEDVLADIDALELDEAADAGVVDPPVADDDAPVTFDVTPAEDIDAIVDWQLSQRDVPPYTGEGRAPRVRYARMSHKACGHPLTKEARAICRAAHRGQGDVAAAS